MSAGYEFDRYLRYEELVDWLHAIAAEHSDLVTLETYGKSYEGRDLWLATITDSTTGEHHTKPAHWVDASIHAVELAACVAACALIEHLVTSHASGDDRVRYALATRTFYVVPRVNPDGGEWVLADEPRFRRSSVRPWPWRDGQAWPGLLGGDVDGDGRVLQMRIADPNGAWMPHPDDSRLMIPVPADPLAARSAAHGPRYRLLGEGSVIEHDGFTIETPRPPEGLDMNRNFPSGWSAAVTGSGDHPLSEPEIDALVRAITQRPNICGYNAFHTSGGWLLRPSSRGPDDKMDPDDVWTFGELAQVGTDLTGYPAHSVFETFTWDKSNTMSGAADDWMYEHRGVFSWTTEFWDIVEAATGDTQSTQFWYLGPTDEQALAVLGWCDEHYPDGFVDWYPFDHPTLGPIELGGWNSLYTWINPPAHLVADELKGHADFAVHQALCSPRLESPHHRVVPLGEGMWRVEVGIANTGWLPTDISRVARKHKLVRPIVAELQADGVRLVAGERRHQIGQLEGRSRMRFLNRNDGTPDRALVSWTVQAEAGTEVEIRVHHERAGSFTTRLVLNPVIV